MQKQLIFTVGMLLVLTGTYPAVAFDGTVYIDGQPCGGFCQAYMAWAKSLGRQRQSAAPSAPAQVSEDPSSRHFENQSPRLAKHRPSRNNGTARARLANQRTPDVRQNQKITSHPQADEVNNQAPGGIPSGHSPTSTMPMTEPRPTADNTNPEAAPVQQSVTTATAGPQPLSDARPSTNPKPTDASPTSDLSGSASETTAAVPSGEEPLVAIIFARPEIGSVSELSGKDIAMIDKQSVSVGSVRSAIIAAGATDVQLSDSGQTNAIEGVIRGRVSAAVLALMTAETADTFPEIAGFRIFRVPMLPR
jgi:hypothetical protein